MTRPSGETPLWAALTSLIGVIGILAGMFWWFAREGEANRKAEADAREALLQVSVLPAGVAELWRAKVDKRLTTVIQRRGRQLVIDLGSPFQTVSRSVVSLNMPYTIECSTYFVGGTITFGSGDTAIEVRIFGFPADGSKSPELGVDSQSVAAASLADDLCVQLADYMQKIVD